MKANGHGRFLQTVVLRVAVADCEAICRQLNIPADEESDTMTKTLSWTRLSRDVRKDDDVLFDLRMELGDLADKTEWRIDWAASHY